VLLNLREVVDDFVALAVLLLVRWKEEMTQTITDHQQIKFKK
jgi:hypothetical protein